MPDSTFRNVIANFLQTAIVTVLMFVLYSYISTALGVDRLGVWSVVLATASASRLADMGLSAGVTRFVARDLARVLPQKAAQVVETGVLTLAALVALVLIGVYPILGKLLAYLFDAEYLPQALEILPYALVSLWLTIVASVALSGLDGCQRMVPRAVIVVLGHGVMLILAFSLVPQWDLLGLAWAQIGQSVFLLAAGWVVLRRSLSEVPLVPWRWHSSVFQEMLRYGANVQVANVSMLLLDPLTKALMAKFGGPTAAGYFEIANQAVLRVRTMIVSANQAIVPRVAHVTETDQSQILVLYRENFRILVFVALPTFSLIVSWDSVISQLLLGADHAQFIFFLQVCSLAWLVNTFSSPAYFINMGNGAVGLNTISHIAIGGLNLLLGWVLGLMYGALGVAWGYALALMLGSIFLFVSFQARHAIRWRDLLPAEHLPLLVVCLVVCLISVADADVLLTVLPTHMRYGLIIIISLLVLSVVLWLHPLRKVLWHRAFGASSRNVGAEIR